MLCEYKDFILGLREQGVSYRNIARLIEENYGYKVTHQAVNKYVNRLSQDTKSNGLELTEDELDIIVKSKSARSACIKLNELGVNIKYDKVRDIRNSIKVR